MPPLLLVETLTSDLLLQTQDDGHGLVQDEQLGLGLLALEVQLAHAAQLLEGLVDVPHAQPLAGVVGHPPLTLTLRLLLRVQVLVLVDATAGRTATERTDRPGSVSVGARRPLQRPRTINTVCS